MERFSVGVLVFLCLRKCILLLVVVVLVGVVSGGVDLPVEAAINEVSDGSLSFMEWWREIGCHLTRWAIDMFVEAANAKRLLPETDDERTVVFSKNPWNISNYCTGLHWYVYCITQKLPKIKKISLHECSNIAL